MKRMTKKVNSSIKRMFRDIDKPLFFVTTVLFIFGLLNIVTASSREAVVRYANPLYYYFFKQLAMLIAGVIAALVIIKVDTKKYKPIAIFAFIVIFGALIYLTLFGLDNRGSKNWIAILGFTFQPSEFAKPVIVVCLALLFELFNKKLHNKDTKHIDMIGIILFVGLAIPAIVFIQKDLGTAFIIACIFGVMFLASPIMRMEKFKTMLVLLVTVVMAGLIMYSVKGYVLSAEQVDRFNFIAPCSNYETGGYQICNGFIAINDGGLLGLGIGKSKQKYSYIPEPHTDSVFAIIAEENGLLRSSLVFIAYLYILKRILDLSSKANTNRGRYICLGVATYIFMHIIVNLGGLFGLLPLTGVPLPFFSYGGSFTISLIISLALVQRVHIETMNEKIRL